MICLSWKAIGIVIKTWFVADSDDCKQCDRVLAEIEHIDDEADGAGIKFVKIDDKDMAKEMGVFALPAVAFYKLGAKEPVIYAGNSRFIYSLSTSVWPFANYRCFQVTCTMKIKSCSGWWRRRIPQVTQSKLLKETIWET